MQNLHLKKQDLLTSQRQEMISVCQQLESGQSNLTEIETILQMINLTIHALGEIKTSFDGLCFFWEHQRHQFDLLSKVSGILFGEKKTYLRPATILMIWLKNSKRAKKRYTRICSKSFCPYQEQNGIL